MSEVLDILSNHVRSGRLHSRCSRSTSVLIILGLVMLVSFSYCDNIICFFLFDLCKYLRIYGLKVVNITEFLTLILKVVRLIVTIISISIIFFITLTIFIT